MNIVTSAHQERRTVFNLCYRGLDSGLVGICYGWGGGMGRQGKERVGRGRKNDRDRQLKRKTQRQRQRQRESFLSCPSFYELLCLLCSLPSRKKTDCSCSEHSADSTVAKLKKKKKSSKHIIIIVHVYTSLYSLLRVLYYKICKLCDKKPIDNFT